MYASLRFLAFHFLLNCFSMANFCHGWANRLHNKFQSGSEVTQRVQLGFWIPSSYVLKIHFFPLYTIILRKNVAFWRTQQIFALYFCNLLKTNALVHGSSLLTAIGHHLGEQRPAFHRFLFPECSRFLLFLLSQRKLPRPWGYSDQKDALPKKIHSALCRLLQFSCSSAARCNGGPQYISRNHIQTKPQTVHPLYIIHRIIQGCKNIPQSSTIRPKSLPAAIRFTRALACNRRLLLHRLVHIQHTKGRRVKARSAAYSEQFSYI